MTPIEFVARWTCHAYASDPDKLVYILPVGPLFPLWHHYAQGATTLWLNMQRYTVAAD